MRLSGNYWKLLGILAVGTVLRFFLLADNPPGLFRDEADKGYTTYSLIETGKDLGGRRWPLQIQSFSAFTSPYYQWASIPSINFLGLDVFSTRLAGALVGSLAVLAVYLVGRAWSSDKLGLSAALFLSISPWHLLFSRWANQGIFMTLFIPLAIWATWRALHASPERRWVFLGWIVGAGFLWGIAWNAYAPARLFVPLFMASIFLIQIVFSEERSSDFFRLLFIGLLSLIPSGPFAVDIWVNWETTQSRLDFLTAGVDQSITAYLTNYFLHFDPRYLFFQGDSNLRHHIPGQGQLSVLCGIFFLLGLYAVFRTKGTWRGWLFTWLVLSPVPAAITHEGLPHALRTLMVVPAFALFSGIGLAWLRHQLGRRIGRWATVLLTLLFAAQLAGTAYLFFHRYANDQQVGIAWEAGLIEALRFMEEERGPDDVCTVTGVLEFPEAFIQFVLQPDPSFIQEGGAIEGYRLAPLGMALDPRVFREEGLYLERAWLVGRPTSWRKVEPPEEFEKMDVYWRLYRVTPSRGGTD